jgi:phosphoglycerol transferase MdoB-like AlkP superfamily enzyme
MFFMSMTLSFLSHKVVAFFFPCKKMWDLYLFFLLFLFKIFWFDYSWCAISTFRPFSYAELYVFGCLFALVLSAPFVFFRKVCVMWILDVMLGFLLVSNLIYFRTYYTAIPLSSYGLIGNMRDFMSSMYASLYWEDVMFPLSTLAAAFFYLKKRSRHASASGKTSAKNFGTVWRYLLLVTVFVLFAGALLHAKGGFKKAYESLQDSYTHTCGTPLYTVVGSVRYDYIRDKEIYTPETGRRIGEWLGRNVSFSDLRASLPVRNTSLPSVRSLPEDSMMQSSKIPPPLNIYLHSSPQDSMIPESRMNCILILAESLESWVLEQTVEGQEITPYMNRLLRDSTTLYAPHVLSQVKGGRSIDAQLMLNTGLLPVDVGVYSLKYPRTFYPSLAKAMKEKYGNAHASTLTADKPIVWNQSVIVPAFGYDSLISRNHFVQDENIGPHYRRQLGDASLLRQCEAKIKRGEAWKDGANMLQIVTYSGHFPFVLPEYLKKVHFSGDVPYRMSDYMTVANYTDHALGLFVEAIRSDPQYNNTLIVITGDHEGLVDMRDDLCRTKAGQSVVSKEPFVPFIVLNVPAARCSALQREDAPDLPAACMRYEKVMGQIDIYPTLLELLGLTDYAWRGLGQSILEPGKKGIAVDAYHRVYGNTSNIPVEDIRHLEDAWKISDEIIRYDYFGCK